VTPRKKQILLILAVFIAVVVADQVTKAIVMHVYPTPDSSYHVLDGPRFFRFVHERNPGVVGGIFRNNRVLSRAAPLMACAVLLYLFWYLDPKSKLQHAAYGLIAGGAAGNLIDRFRLGSVTDFLQFHFYFVPFDFPWKYYPAFNVADSCICTGVFTLIVAWYIMGEPHVADNR